MATQRRMGVEGAKNRELLVDAAERVMRGEGYAAATARRVAAEAGLKVQLVYYYFQTMDDLILALVHRNKELRLKRFEEHLQGEDPLTDLWKTLSDPEGALLSAELVALANHRESIRNEIVAAARAFRSKQAEAIDRYFVAKGIDRTAFPPAGVVAIIAALARTMVQDKALGWEDGYPEAVTMLEHYLEQLKGLTKNEGSAQP